MAHTRLRDIPTYRFKVMKHLIFKARSGSIQEKRPALALGTTSSKS